MSQSAKKQYLIAILERYHKSSKNEKGLILDEFCAICGYKRKYAIRLLNGQLTIPLTKRGRKPHYTQETIDHLIVLWRAMGKICSKRLKAAIPEWLEYYDKPLTDEVRAQLLTMSASTIDRALRASREQKAISTTVPSKCWFKARIPIQSDDSHIKEPGFVTGDTVAHCGDDISGSYAHTLTVTDLATTWTANRAIWRKGMVATKEALRSVEESFPFSITGFKSDCGTEFINNELFKYFVQREEPVCLYRSRPYHKNDNCHVEQKNFTHVRRLFGYERFDDQSLIDLMNDIYINYWNPLQNYFIPTMKLLDKNRVESKVKKKFDKPQTPYDRVMSCPYISDSKKALLKLKKSKLNPFHLQLELEVKLREFKERANKAKNLLQAA